MGNGRRPSIAFDTSLSAGRRLVSLKSVLSDESPGPNGAGESLWHSLLQLSLGCVSTTAKSSLSVGSDSNPAETNVDVGADVPGGGAT